METVRELADGNRNTARAEVVAAFDELCCVGVAEQSLQFALFGRVALLHFRTALLQGRKLVGFGRACCTAAAVTACSAAQKHDDVAGGGDFAAHVLCGSRADYRADFQTLGNIAVVIKLIDLPRGKTDLVAVGAVACRRGGNQLSLRELTRHGVLYRL